MQQDKFEYFMKRTEEDLSEIKLFQKDLQKDVKKLLEFKWQIVGGSLVLSALLSGIISMLINGSK